MKKLELSYRSRKALSVHVGEAASAELIDFLEQLTERVEQLERGKVDVIQVVPTSRRVGNTLPQRKAA